MIFFIKSGTKSVKIFMAGKTVVKRVLVGTDGKSTYYQKEPSKYSYRLKG